MEAFHSLVPRSPVLDEVLSGWRAEATNATDPEYEVGNVRLLVTSDNVIVLEHFSAGVEGGRRRDRRLYSG